VKLLPSADNWNMTCCGVRLLSQIALFSATIAAAGAGPVDVHGTARAGGQPIANAVVWLEAPNLPETSQKERVVLDQRNLAFNPHVLAVRVGTVVDFPNSDRVFHNVFSFRDGKRFDLGLYPVGSLRHVQFDHAGLSRIFCNIHPNMAAYVMAVDSPYFAVTDAAGAFTIPSVAARRYTYHAWRAGAAQLSGTWRAEGEAPLTVSWP
jgi:plastocyanin